MKFKSKSLISIILSIMMVISMIIVAIPANAAVADSVPVGDGATSYYLWYRTNTNNTTMTQADYTRLEMTKSGTLYSAHFAISGNHAPFVAYINTDLSTMSNGVVSINNTSNDTNAGDYYDKTYFDWANYGSKANYLESGCAFIKAQIKSSMSVKITYDNVTGYITLSNYESSTDEYQITPVTTSNGKFTVSPTSAAENDTVTVNTTPDSGYEVETVTYTYGTTTANATASETNKYTFQMPAADVTVNVTFKQSSTSDKITVYFKNTSNWSTVKCYAWVGSTKNADYPGVAMTKVDSTDNIYSIVLESKYVNCIFNDGGNSNKTGDLTINAGKMYDFSASKWVNYPETPSGTSYYIGGRFKVKDHTTIEDGTYSEDWNPGCTTSYFKMIENPNVSGEYILETNMTTFELSQNIGSKNYNPYFIIHTGSGLSNFYGRTKGTTLLHDCEQYTSDNKVTLDNCNNSGDAAENQFLKFTDTDGTYASKGNVTLHFNPTTKEFYYTTDGSSTPGKFIIEDKTDANGKLTFSAPDKPAGTADAGNTVTITGTPLNSYYELSNVSVSYKVGKTEVSLVASNTDGKFTFAIPSDLDYTTVKDATISVKGTFTLTSTGKLEYVKAQGAGLYIDVAPTKDDTTATLIKWNNYQGKDQGTSNPYTFYVPKNVNLANAVIYNTTGSQITLGDKTINNNDKAEGVSLTVGDNTITGGSVNNVKVMQGSTDAMFLNTTKEDGTDFDLPTKRRWTYDQGITDKQANEYKAEIESSGGSCTTMDNTSGTAKFSSAMGLDTVKGRGNSSWKASATMFGKFAFNMKLKSKTNLLGMDSAESSGAKSWCLLANNADESMLRNALTYQLASEIGLLYSPEFRFVDIYDNGEYMGSYLVTEKVDVGSSKLVKGISYDDINEDYAKESGLTEVNEKTSKGTYNNNSTDNMQYAMVTVDGVTTNVPCDNTVEDAKLKGKYLLEFEITDRYTDEASWFTSPRGQHVVVKNPEFATKEQVTFIAQKFAAMEDKVFNNASKSELSTVMDVESFAKMYLIQEFSSNLDAASTSYYLTFDCSQANPVFVANPVWDYDWAYGQYTNTNNIGAKKPVSGNGQDAYLQTSNPEKWVAKYKSMDDSKGGSAYSIQSQLASKNSDFKTEIRKQWEGANGFYAKIKGYYGTDGQIMTWYNQIKDSVNMNETRWGFIESDPISGWGSTETGDTHADAVNYLNNTWTAARATWLNTQFTSDEYPAYTPSAPTIKAYAADGTTEISAVDAGSPFIIKVTSDLESGVVYRLYKDGVKVGTDQSDGNFDIATDESMVGSKYTYTVTAVYGGRESSDSTGVEITINEKAGKKTVRVYFKSAAASAYVPSFSLDNAAATVMSRTPKTPTENGTYFGSTYSGSLKFYWFFKDITIDTSVPHTITFTTKDNRVNATDSYTFGAATEYYFAVDNLMGDTNLINLTGKDEYIRNYHISATHMVHSTTDDNNVGFTWMKDSDGNYKEYAMGTYLEDNKISTASLTDLTSSSLLTIPSALTPNAMLQASTAPSFFTIKSATLAQRITADISEVSTLQYQLLDVNLDGVVDVKDSTMMQKALANF